MFPGYPPTLFRLSPDALTAVLSLSSDCFFRSSLPALNGLLGPVGWAGATPFEMHNGTLGTWYTIFLEECLGLWMHGDFP